MLQFFLMLTIKCLLKFPSVLPIDGVIYKLLDLVEEAPIKTRYGYSIYFRRTGCSATNPRKVVILGRYEKHYLNMLTKLVEPGDYVVDVGAHEGYVSLLMSHIVGKNGRVYSIEPNVENLEYLRRNIKLNSIENLQILEKAISDNISKSTYYYDDDKGSEGSLTQFPYLGARKSVTVDIETLDNLFYQKDYANRIKLIKVDIEGNEMKAIMGADKLISECRPHIAFEVSLTYWAYLDVSIEVLFNFLRNHGYELFVVKDKNLYPYEWLYERVLNLIAIHQSRKSDLLQKGIFAKSA